MLQGGHAWAYRRYMQNSRACDLEQEARSKKLGLWAQPVSDWVYPPEWRFLKNGEIRVVPTPYEETLEKCLTTYSRAGKGTYEPPNNGTFLVRLRQHFLADSTDLARSSGVGAAGRRGLSARPLANRRDPASA
jgi:hypothetical protein